jgi:hypothetical protein
VISDVLLFLKNELNTHLGRNDAAEGGDGLEDKVVFLDGEKMDPVSFKLGAVTILLINVEEEAILRAPNPYARVAADGAAYGVQPDIRINLCVLFVARFKQYEQALANLSKIIQYFQGHRVFDRRNAPALDGAIDKLIMELLTLPFSEQNDLWNALRTTYHPSVLYKVKTIVFEDQQAQTTSPVTGSTLNVLHASRSAV